MEHFETTDRANHAELTQERHTSEDALGFICRVIQENSGRDFSGYKRSTLERRVSMRMHMSDLDQIDQYLNKLALDPQEQEALARDFLIHVTSFFRDVENFEALARLVLRPMIEQADASDAIRIWVPGCSTGQEAFTLAMITQEICQQQNKSVQVSVFASDVDETTIEQASCASYPIAMLDEIPEPYRSKYTAVSGQHFEIVPQVREKIVFLVHDITKDPPLANIDLVSCRNLLIYLDDELQEQLFSAVHFSLGQGGHVFLGASESVWRAQDLFAPVDKRARIYRRNDAAEQGNAGLPPTLNSQDVRVFAHASGEGARAMTFAATDHLQPVFEHTALQSLSQKHRIAQLEGDLHDTRLTLKGKADEIESANEELRSSNEEVLAMNEELQSANEELIEANDELKNKIDEITQVNADLDNFLQSADLAMIVLDRRACIRHITNAARNMLPLLQSYDGRALSELPNPVDGIDLTERVGKVMETGEAFAQTTRVTDVGQSYVVRITPHFRTDGTVEGASITFLDISQVVELRRDLVAETRKLRLAMDTALMGSWDTDLETGKMILDPVAAELVGLEAGVEVEHSDFYRHLCPQDYENYMKVRERALASGKGYSYTLRFMPPGEPTKWIRVHKQPYRDVSGCQKVTGLGFEVTESMHLQQELQEQSDLRELVMNAGRMGMADLDAERGVFNVDDVLAEHLNLTKTGEIPLDEMLANLLEEDAGLVREQLTQAIEKGEEYELDFRVSDPAVGIRWVRTRGRPYTTIDGVKKVAGPTLDISAMKDQQMLVEEMSHRIKNLFAVVAGLIQATPKQSAEAEHMASDLLDRVVSLGRVYDLARKDNAMKGVPLNDLLMSVLKPHAVGHSIAIEGPRVFVDGDQVNTLTLIIHELTTNAAKYGALGSPEGAIDISWTVVGNRNVKLKWLETRPNFSPPQESRGFGSLLIDTGVRQLKGTCTRRFVGTGASIDLDLSL